MNSEMISTIIRMNLVGMYGVLLVLAIRFILRKISYKYVYMLWLVVFGMLVLPIRISGGFTLIPPVLEQSYVGTVERLENEVTDQIVHDDMLMLNEYTTDQPNLVELAGENAHRDMNWEFLFEIIWCGGFLLFILWETVRYVRLYRYIRKQKATERDSSGKIVTLKGLDSSFVFGFLRPVIYLSDDMTQEERAYILAHEQYHCKRKDPFVKTLAMLITFAYWYNPIVWIGYHFLCIDMELSCDEAVLKEYAGVIKKNYAASLLKYGALQNRYMISAMTFGKPSLKSRIQNVLNYKRKNIIFTGIALIIVAVVAVGLFSRTAVEESGDFFNESKEENTLAEEVVEEGYEKTIWGDFDQNGVEEYTVASLNKTNPGYEGRLQFFWNGECIYDYDAILRLFVSEAGTLDLDEDGEEEIYIIFNSFVNSMPLQEYIVLKQRGEGWEPLEMFHGETMLDNAFPIMIKGGSAKTAVISCDGTEQTVSYGLEFYWDNILSQIAKEQSEGADFSFVEDLVKQDRENFKEGEPYGSVQEWGIWEVKQGSFEERNCLIASHSIAGIDGRMYPLGILDIYFNYDQNGQIQILNLEFKPQYPI